jgi:hypothetical protein
MKKRITEVGRNHLIAMFVTKEELKLLIQGLRLADQPVSSAGKQILGYLKRELKEFKCLAS